MTDEKRYDAEALKLIRTTLAKDCDDQEFELFIQQCERTHLDPFARQIYTVARYDSRAGRNKSQTQVSIDGARLTAQRSGEYSGQTAVFYCGKDRQWVDLWLPEDGFPKAAKVGVYRRGFVEPLWATATWDQYAQTNKEGKPNVMWGKMPALMLGKCAEMLALRKAFPMELSGLYSAEEMGQADNPPMADTPVHNPAVTKRSAPVVNHDEPAAVTPASDEQRRTIKDGLEMLHPDERASFAQWWEGSGITRGVDNLDVNEANTVYARLLSILNAASQVDETEGYQPVEGQIGPHAVIVESVSEDAKPEPSIAATVKQTGYIRKLCTERHAEPHAVCSEILGRTIVSLNDLTKAEAKKVIDQLLAL